MKPAQADYPVARRGDTIPARTITVTQDGSSVDLSTVDIQMDLVLRGIRVQLRVGAGITKTDAAAGVFRVDGFKLAYVGTWKYDLQLVYTDGTTRTLLFGRVEVLEDITQ